MRDAVRNNDDLMVKKVIASRWPFYMTEPLPIAEIEKRKREVKYFDPLSHLAVEECLLHMAINNENKTIFDELV